jgi:DNA-binding response OmpR family regulator
MSAFASYSTRILFVDVDPDTRSVMARLLRREGFEVRTAGTCQSALATAQDAPIDLLITDYLLPDGEGPRILAHLCAQRKVEGILVSGADLADTTEAHVFARRLTKPIRFPDLLTAIAELAGSRAPAVEQTA